MKIKCENVCAICGRRYIPKGNNSKYCSLECKELGTNQKKEAWKKKHSRYITEYMRKYREGKNARQG